MKHESRVITLEGALNVRELGGLPLRNGRIVKHGKLIRSGRLSNLTDADRHLLTDHWNVTTIIDLRNLQEISEYPDMNLDGASHHHIRLIEDGNDGISREDNGMEPIDRAILRVKELHEHGGSKKLLESMYAQMAESTFCLNQIKEFFRILLNQKDGSLIWHCTSGKDRTGVTGALLLYVLGADMDTIKDDYLYTNEQNHNYREKILQIMRERHADEVLVEEMRTLESVDSSYIDSFFQMIKKSYGSVDAFLIEKVGLSEDKIVHLRESYTEG